MAGLDRFHCINTCFSNGSCCVSLTLLQEDLVSFVDFRTTKIKQEEQFKYEVR